jgi:selenocysteine-specific elongation factor
MVLGPVGLFRTTQVADCRFDLLATAQPLKHGAPIHFHAGTAEVEAEVRMLRGAGALEPGTGGFVRLRLREPLLLLPGDRFIARMFSPVVTIGGGEVIDNAPPARMRRAAALERLPGLWRAGLEQQLSLWAAEEETGAGLAELAARGGVREGDVLAGAEGAGLVVVKGEKLRLVARAAVDGVVAKLTAELGRFHRENPLLPGMAKAAAPAAAWLVDAALGRTAEIVAEGENLRLRSFQPKMQAEEDAAAGKMEGLFREGGLAVPGVAEVLGQSGLDANRAKTVLQLLLREGRLVRISAELIYHREAVERLRGLLGEKKGVRFGVAEFKEWTGVSRKYAIPMLEWLDRERVTRREGEKRQIL